MPVRRLRSGSSFGGTIDGPGCGCAGSPPGPGTLLGVGCIGSFQKDRNGPDVVGLFYWKTTAGSERLSLASSKVHFFVVLANHGFSHIYKPGAQSDGTNQNNLFAINDLKIRRERRSRA